MIIVHHFVFYGLILPKTKPKIDAEDEFIKKRIHCRIVILGNSNSKRPQQISV